MSTFSEIKKEIKNCSECNAVIETYLGSSSYNVICPKCSCVYNYYDGWFIKSFKKLKPLKEKPIIDIGTIGVIDKIKYITLSFVLKKESGTDYSWHEYTLFNPIYGLAYLTMYNGHWMLLKEITEIPNVEGRSAYLNNERFELYSRYRSKVDGAVGEFLFNFSPDEKPQIEEFILPPYIITSEKTEDNLVWLKGEYYAPNQIKNGFNLVDVPDRIGVGQIQPYVAKFKTKFFKQVLILLALIWGTMQVVFDGLAKEEVVFKNYINVNDSTTGKDYYTNSFELKHGTKNVEITMVTSVFNSWIYAGATLVNEKTGDVYDFELEAEYYHGYTDGESWSEGTNWSSKVASSVPEGTYYLIIRPEKPTSLNNMSIGITLTRDVFISSNGLILLILMAIFPAYYFYKQRKFEENRWYNSNYSPYED
ncbi:MAG: DUF4178 domain-containing protein [Bacteroidota bacterium]